MPPFTIIPMQTEQPMTPEETATERSLTITLGTLAVGFTLGFITAAGLIASLPSN